ncbi:hypothetical protein KC343_g819 [Hortaea werneckii]|nr:hypothetical protein KC352_g4838 [Hortaea werneckii]KAI7572320.1 hypothetical protein KC317_g869 [Hortaea werneckii]KAI7627315.1 hypothetical protein KC346_g803 [Hortaea werneckii]KAI7637236.1 hypothetical protein KC343_g819 [Hortaea werneckii]KAI7682897.1 hypothetical protein KC319_g749 [Hortaea werneckii]
MPYMSYPSLPIVEEEADACGRNLANSSTRALYEPLRHRASTPPESLSSPKSDGATSSALSTPELISAPFVVDADYSYPEELALTPDDNGIKDETDDDDDAASLEHLSLLEDAEDTEFTNSDQNICSTIEGEDGDDVISLCDLCNYGEACNLGDGHRGLAGKESVVRDSAHFSSQSHALDLLAAAAVDDTNLPCAQGLQGRSEPTRKRPRSISPSENGIRSAFQ